MLKVIFFANKISFRSRTYSDMIGVLRYNLIVKNKVYAHSMKKPGVVRYYSKKAENTPQSTKNVQNPETVNALVKSRKIKLLAIGGGCFSLYLVGLFFYEKQKLEEREKKKRQAVSITICHPADKSGLKITLYQFQTCPFCCKVRAFLDYYGFSYNVVEVNSITKKQIKWSNYRKVPFVIIETPSKDNEQPKYVQLKDSSVIISILTSCLRNPRESLEDLLLCFPSYRDPQNNNTLQFDNKYFIMYTDQEGLAKEQKNLKKERRLRRWVDDRFIHTISPNIYRSPTEAVQSFNWFSKAGEWERLFSSAERLLIIYVGAAAMWILGKRLKSKYNLNSDPRITLYDQADLWVREVNTVGSDFIGGDEPNIADLSMYGVLSAMEGCEAFEDMKTRTNIGEWYYKMKEAVGQHKGRRVLSRRGAIY